MNAQSNQPSASDVPWGDADFWVNAFVSDAGLSIDDAKRIASDWMNAGRPSGFLGLYAAEKGLVPPVAVKSIVERLLRPGEASTQSAATPSPDRQPAESAGQDISEPERAKVLRPPSVRQPKIVKTKRPSIF